MSNKKQFFFNPSDNKKSFDVYKDKNPKDTIPIKYATLKDTKETIKKLEKLYKDGKYPHNRISKVAMILMVRLRIINPNDPRTKLAISYFNFLKERTKEKNDKKRKELKFKI
jgi:hypothetical protein